MNYTTVLFSLQGKNKNKFVGDLVKNCGRMLLCEIDNDYPDYVDHLETLKYEKYDFDDYAKRIEE